MPSKSASTKRQSPSEDGEEEKAEKGSSITTVSKRRRTASAKNATSAPEVEAATSKLSAPSSSQTSSSSTNEEAQSSVYDGEWATLFEEHLENKSHETMIAFLSEQFIHFGLPRTELNNLIHFITMMSYEYNDNVYHNFMHACHVTLNCCYFLSKLSHPEDFSTVEKLALLFSAIIHDAGHLGVSNHALINKNHDLAKKYHDQSVAEMHSLTLGLEALQHGEHALIRHFDPEEKRLFRKLMIELVLGTDIADPYKKKITYDRVEELSNAVTGELPISLTSHDCKSVLLVLILRASDVGSSMQSIHTSQLWAKNFYLETKLASLVGDAPHIEPSHCHVTQINYFERHSQFLVKKLIRTNGILDSFTTHLLHNVDENIQAWKKHGFELIREWDNEPVLTNHTRSSVATAGTSSSFATLQTGKGKKQKKIAVLSPETENDIDSGDHGYQKVLTNLPDEEKSKVHASTKEISKKSSPAELTSSVVNEEETEAKVGKGNQINGKKGKASRR